MPALLRFIDNHARANFYKGIIVVYVEGSDDVDFLKSLYQDNDLIEFQCPDSIMPPSATPIAGGCQAVITRVRAESADNRNIYGIIDRDYYKNPSTVSCFLESNDNNFVSKIGNNVHILRRWEIENYFADPDALKYTIQRVGGDKVVRNVNNEEILNKLVKICESLIIVGAASLTLHIHGEKDFPDEWNYPIGCPQDVEAHIIGSSEFLNKNHLINEFRVHLSTIGQFDCGSADQKIRLRHLLRIVDGKRLFSRFKKEFKLKIDVRRLAASDCREKRVDTEDLAAFIESLIR